MMFISKKYFVIVWMILLAPLFGFSQIIGNQEAIVIKKNYPFLSYVIQNKEVKQLLKNDAILQQWKRSFRQQTEALIKEKDNPNNVYAIFDQLMLNDSAIGILGERLDLILKNNSSVSNWLIANKLAYIAPISKQQNLTVQYAWNKDLEGIRYSINVYGKGAKPHYPNIDSMSVEHANTRTKLELQRIFFDVVENTLDDDALFFMPSLKTATGLLEINGRYNATDFEPMEFSVNKNAVAKAKKVSWSAFSYSHILVLGAGPEIAADSINPLNILRCRLAAEQYLKKVAPFIMVSGGRVHPYKTEYSEAMEMKKYMVNELHIPDEAIIMEPHARHTTTNIRNAVRLLVKYGIPTAKPGIIVTTRDQSGWLTDDGFVKRCSSEMGIVPFSGIKRIYSTAVSYIPEIQSLYIDNKEPLDP